MFREGIPTCEFCGIEIDSLPVNAHLVCIGNQKQKAYLMGLIYGIKYAYALVSEGVTDSNEAIKRITKELES